VAELYRRALQKVTVHETEAVLREGREAPPDWFPGETNVGAGGTPVCVVNDHVLELAETWAFFATTCQ